MKIRIVMVCLCLASCLALSYSLARTNNAPVDNNTPGNKEAKAGQGGQDKDNKVVNEDEAAIRKALDAYHAAYAKGEVDAVLAFWTPDAEFIDDDGKVYSGRPALNQIFSKSLPSYKGYKITCKLTSMRLIKPDVALVDGVETFTPPKGEPDVSRFTSVWVKSNGQWLIRSARDLTPEPTGETVAARRLRELEWMVGSWVSEAADATVHLNVNWTLNKAFLIWEYEVKTKQGASTKVTQFVGWDASREQIKSWVFDDQGGSGEALWTRAGNTWTSESFGVLPDGGNGSAINVLKYRDDNTFIWESLRREADGQPLPDVEAKFTRHAPKP